MLVAHIGQCWEGEGRKGGRGREGGREGEREGEREGGEGEEVFLVK